MTRNTAVPGVFSHVEILSVPHYLNTEAYRCEDLTFWIGRYRSKLVMDVIN